jgi:predicted PurR-regulated permease PerM
MFIAFYLFIDGRSFLEEFKRLSPLDRRYSQEIIDELFKPIKLTFKGSLVIAVVQGILGATGFLLCGIDSWALWGTVMVLASLIPVVGTALIWGPAAIFQAVTGHLWAAGFIVFWGVAVIGLADNLLRPQLLKGDTNIHPLFIFFSVMGGLSYFGFLGIILGPLILSLLVYILNMYKKFINPQPLKIDT